LVLDRHAEMKYTVVLNRKTIRKETTASGVPNPTVSADAGEGGDDV